MWQKGLFLKVQEGLAVVETDYEKRQVLISTNSEFVIQKIKEELENISDEGKVKAQKEGDFGRHTEEFWKEFVASEKEKKSPTIQQVLIHLEKVTPKELFITLNSLRNTVIDGDTNWEV